jgi:NAD(P)-dependent dehydrogenase (short-subunit alcohol dehydrogenase family)
MSEPRPTREHALVTGGAGGIGVGIATVLARSGAAVTLVDYRMDALEAAAVAIRAAVPGAEIDHIVADLTTADQPGAAVRTAWERAGGLDLVVNGAGIYPSTPLLQLTAKIWDAIQDVNVRSAVLTTVAFGQLVERAGRTGSVVNITSGAALRARPAAAPYSTSKAALEMWTKASALELGPLGIRVNAVSPGFVGVQSPVNPYEEAYRQGADRNPLGRDGTPEDIGEAVRWVSSDAAGWVTGTIIRVDGGSSTGNSGLPRSWPVMSLGVHGEVAAGD